MFGGKPADFAESATRVMKTSELLNKVIGLTGRRIYNEGFIDPFCSYPDYKF
jgi:hypothetical protein